MKSYAIMYSRGLSVPGNNHKYITNLSNTIEIVFSQEL